MVTAKTLRDGETLCDCFLRAQDFLSPAKEVKIPRQCGKKLRWRDHENLAKIL